MWVAEDQFKTYMNFSALSVSNNVWAEQHKSKKLMFAEPKFKIVHWGFGFLFSRCSLLGVTVRTSKHMVGTKEQFEIQQANRDEDWQVPGLPKQREYAGIRCMKCSLSSHLLMGSIIPMKESIFHSCSGSFKLLCWILRGKFCSASYKQRELWECVISRGALLAQKQKHVRPYIKMLLLPTLADVLMLSHFKTKLCRSNRPETFSKYFCSVVERN